LPGIEPTEPPVPRVNDKRADPATGERKRFASAILPPWARKTPKITEVLPLLYLHGLSSGDFVPALGQFLGSAAGLSATVITRLTETWRAEQRAFAARDLSGVDYVYLWADGIHVNIRLEEHKLCLLVMIGVRADGRKELVALADGYRESAESWADLLRDCARRGMRAPVLAVGDGALGFWNGLREVFPQAKEGRCWFHKTASVLAALPKSAHPGAKKALAEIWNAEDKTCARAAVKAFEAAYGAKFPKAVAKITDDAEELLAFYDYPAEHWVHLRTTNPSRPSPPSGTGPRSPRARARGRPGWRWRSSSSSQRKTAGAPSTHPTSWPCSAPERPSPAASSSSGPHSRPSPKLPNDLDRQVLAIVPASSPSGPGTQTSAPYVQRLSGRPAARRAPRRRLRDRPAGGAPPSRGTRALPSAPESPGGTSTLGMRPLLAARTSSAGSTAGSATMQVPALAVSAEATTESGHPNLAGVECPG
jgi:Transposase, Mutator family